jgi:hypothetical protein
VSLGTYVVLGEVCFGGGGILLHNVKKRWKHMFLKHFSDCHL